MDCSARKQLLHILPPQWRPSSPWQSTMVYPFLPTNDLNQFIVNYVYLRVQLGIDWIATEFMSPSQDRKVFNGE